MKKEIKFRAWDKENRRMIEYCDLSLLNEFWETGKDDVFSMELEVMQYTGLKDKNDIEIYEGDILKFEYAEESYYPLKGTGFDTTLLDDMAIVVFKDGGYYLEGVHNKRWRVDISICLEDRGNKPEVIGNKYEDKKLIEEDE